jgi:transposase-like protein
MTTDRRVFSPEVKLSTVKRILAGEDIRELARELKLRRTFLYRWKDLYRKGGAAAFKSRRGRPAKPIGERPGQPVEDLSAAKRRIADLERKIGQQELELDFFRRALRQVGAKRRPNKGPGAKPSTSSSKR